MILYRGLSVLASVIGTDFFNELLCSQDFFPITQFNQPPVASAVQQKIKPGLHIFLFVGSNMPALPQNIIIDLHFVYMGTDSMGR